MKNGTAWAIICFICLVLVAAERDRQEKVLSTLRMGDKYWIKPYSMSGYIYQAEFLGNVNGALVFEDRHADLGDFNTDWIVPSNADKPRLKQKQKPRQGVSVWTHQIVGPVGD